jgi:hypothetical protein
MYVDGAAFDGFYGISDLTHPRDDDEGQRRVGALYLVEQLQPVHPFHAHVANHGVEAHAIDDLHRRSSVRRELAFVPFLREEDPECFAHLHVVVHDENARVQIGSSDRPWRLARRSVYRRLHGSR